MPLTKKPLAAVLSLSPPRQPAQLPYPAVKIPAWCTRNPRPRTFFCNLPIKVFLTRAWGPRCSFGGVCPWPHPIPGRIQTRTTSAKNGASALCPAVEKVRVIQGNGVAVSFLRKQKSGNETLGIPLFVGMTCKGEILGRRTSGSSMDGPKARTPRGRLLTRFRSPQPAFRRPGRGAWVVRLNWYPPSLPDGPRSGNFGRQAAGGINST